MAFNVPNFNLAVKIWRIGGVGGAYAAPDVVTVVNLSQGKRVMFARTTAGTPAALTEALLPKLTDIRATWNGLGADLVEAPAGSKRFYSVEQVDDVAKGYANEYRLALLIYSVTGNTTLAGGPYPAPVPLP